MEKTFIIAFIALYVANMLLDLFLTWLNLRHMQKHTEPPKIFQDHISKEKYEKSVLYTVTKAKLGIVSSIFGSIVFVAFIYLGGLNWWDLYLREIIASEIHRGVAFFLTLAIASHLISTPFDLYANFVIEEKFGFNRQTFGLWFFDQIKGLILSSIIGGVMGYAVLYFMANSGEYWWLYVWGVVFLFGFTLAKLYPVLIAPIFNKFTPVEDEKIRSVVEKLSSKTNFPLENIYVMDASQRSSHPNAYFAGMGKNKRLVLYDSLVDGFTADEIAAVVAHEIGHDKHKHIWKSLIFSQAVSLSFFYLLSVLWTSPYLYSTFLVDNSSTYMGLLLLNFVSSVVFGFFSPVGSFLSWKYEWEADAYSKDAVEEKEGIKTLLIKLAEKSLSNLYPHPWYARFYYSHPPILQRLEKLGFSE